MVKVTINYYKSTHALLIIGEGGISAVYKLEFEAFCRVRPIDFRADYEISARFL